MTAFVVLPTDPDASKIEASIKTKFPSKFLSLPRGAWLVGFEGTSKQLSDLLGISDGESGNGIVLHISGYWGRADTNIWEWIKVNNR